MDSPESRGLSIEAMYVLCAYLLHRLDLADRRAGRLPASDELLALLGIIDPPRGENVVQLFETQNLGPALDELRSLAERVKVRNGTK